MQANIIPVAAKTIAASAMMAHMHFAFVCNSLLRLLFHHCALLIDRLSRFTLVVIWYVQGFAPLPRILLGQSWWAIRSDDMVRTRLSTLAKNIIRGAAATYRVNNCSEPNFEHGMSFPISKTRLCFLKAAFVHVTYSLPVTGQVWWFHASGRDAFPVIQGPLL